MKVVILGAHGMIGGGLARYLREIGYDVSELGREDFCVCSSDKLSDVSDKLESSPNYLEADLLINCIGIVKQYYNRYPQRHFEFVNGIFPQYLSKTTNAHNKNLLHVSSDCVFTGLLGNYNENHHPDADDIYGQSKAMGEQISDMSIVVRTSTIGIERGSAHGLLSWYVSQSMPVEGYLNAIYSGLSLKELAVSIHHLLGTDTRMGLYNISSEPISKFDLLYLMYLLAIGPKPLPVNSPIIDRSLDDTKFRLLTKLKKPSWIEMVHDIKFEVEELKNGR